jgi:hypothetical protein
MPGACCCLWPWWRVWRWLKSCRLGTYVVVGGEATLSFGGALGGISQCVERSRICSAMCVTTGHPCQCTPGVAVRIPLFTRLVVARALCAPFRSYAYQMVLPTCQGLNLWVWLPQQNLGEVVHRWWWCYPCRGWRPMEPLPIDPGPNHATSGVGVAPMGALY